jgi:alpha-N-acetylglucosaminidase
MANLFWDLYQLWQASFRRADEASASALAKAMLSLIADWDALLLTHEGFLFGRWVSDAKAWARGDEAEEKIYLINAKNQVTLWGPKAVDLPHLYGYNIGK